MLKKTAYVSFVGHYSLTFRQTHGTTIAPIIINGDVHTVSTVLSLVVSKRVAAAVATFGS